MPIVCNKNKQLKNSPIDIKLQDVSLYTDLHPLPPPPTKSQDRESAAERSFASSKVAIHLKVNSNTHQ